ncbi:MAG: 50S ribosomal protein L20 [Armatimonadota bacterium]|jgi:large subunit ribosomal protein L20|nr:MAG: 50S ribosomal protein L20 [Armatimonadota bacterium]
MARVKRGVMTHKRHKKIIDQASGYWGGRHRLFKTAKEAVMHAGQYAYRDRRNRKRDFRRLWVTRISAACRNRGFRYSQFIDGLDRAGVAIDRKVLAHLAVEDTAAFDRLVDLAKQAISA